MVLGVEPSDRPDGLFDMGRKERQRNAGHFLILAYVRWRHGALPRATDVRPPTPMCNRTVTIGVGRLKTVVEMTLCAEALVFVIVVVAIPIAMPPAIMVPIAMPINATPLQ